MSEPIACTLGSEDRRSRREEWRSFLTDEVDDAVRDSPSRYRVRLERSSNDVATRAIDLAMREKTCCAFFDFSLRIDTSELWLEIAVPEGAASVLDELASMREVPSLADGSCDTDRLGTEH